MNNSENKVIMPEIDPAIAATLFENKSTNTVNDGSDVDFEAQNMDMALMMPQAPEDMSNDGEVIEVSAETILDAIMSSDEKGHSPSTIIATIEKLHNVEEDMDLDSVPDDDHEYIDDISIEDCGIDMYTLDGLIFNLVMKFDNSQSAYLKEINEMCNRYRAMQEDMATNPDADSSTVPMLSVTFMPHKLNGLGAMVVSFPIGYFRTLNDDGVNCSFFMQFWATNVSFSKIDIDDETRSELTADVLRELEEGNNGQMFE